MSTKFVLFINGWLASDTESKIFLPLLKGSTTVKSTDTAAVMAVPDDCVFVVKSAEAVKQETENPAFVAEPLLEATGKEFKQTVDAIASAHAAAVKVAETRKASRLLVTSTAGASAAANAAIANRLMARKAPAPAPEAPAPAASPAASPAPAPAATGKRH